MSSVTTADNHDVGRHYDEVPYVSLYIGLLQPSHLKTIATLFGLTPPDVKTARVLEIGCAEGANLLPAALHYPKAQFLGIDISQVQITAATKQKESLKLDNIEFRQQDLLEFDTAANKGKFDYIICHGVFSWVPELVSEKILQVCKECLSSDGLAIVSYNTLPGSSVLRNLRDMMLYHTKPLATPAEKIEQARLLTDFLGDLIPPEREPAYRALINGLRQEIKACADAYLYHEYLEDMNRQFYFHEFMKQARAHHLDYVGDVNLGMMYYAAMPPEAVKRLKELKGHVIEAVSLEQYTDFVTNRRFRMTLLCKAGQKINHDLKNEQIMDYALAPSPGIKTSGSDPKEKITFSYGTNKFSTNDEISGILFLELLACGDVPVAADILVERVQKKLGLKSPDKVRAALIEQGLNLVLHNYIRIYLDIPPHVTEVSEKPVAFSPAREQAANENSNFVTNVAGRPIIKKGLDREVLKQLDGSRTCEDVVDIVVDAAQKLIQGGEVAVKRADGSPVKNASELREPLTAAAQDILQKLAKEGLLVG